MPGALKDILQHALGLGVIAIVGWTIVNSHGADMEHHLRALLDGFARQSERAQDSDTDKRSRKDCHTDGKYRNGVHHAADFPAVRHVGVSLLASAGLAGLIVGMAARSTLSNLIAGVQVALTQPVRIEDAIVLEGELGRIEEINTTYVVVRLWDLRRLIVPLSYFIEKPFQNWTHTTANILGTVTIYADYSSPVQELREELNCILETTEPWDKKTWALQVTDATEWTMRIRA